jgi:hypothetical protein
MVLQTKLSRGYTYLSGRLYLTDSKGNTLKEIKSQTLEGRVGASIHNEIKLSLSLRGLDLSEIVPFTSYVQPRLVMGDAYGNREEYPLGLYVCTPASKSHAHQRSTMSLEGRSLEWILANSYPSGVFTASAGSNPVAHVRTILDNHGIRHTIPDTTVTLALSRTWDVDKSWLEITNDLLGAAAFYTLHPDLEGWLTTEPYFELASAQPALSLFSGEGSSVIRTIEQDPVYDQLINKVTVYKENSQGSPIRVIRTNNDPDSEVSVVNLKDANGNPRILHRVYKDSNIETVTEAKALARRLLEEGSSTLNRLTVQTFPLPERKLHEVYDLAIYNAAGASIGYGLWWCDGWEIGFTPRTAAMSHYLKRLEPYGWDEVATP